MRLFRAKFWRKIKSRRVQISSNLGINSQRREKLKLDSFMLALISLIGGKLKLIRSK